MEKKDANTPVDKVIESSAIEEVMRLKKGYALESPAKGLLICRNNYKEQRLLNEGVLFDHARELLSLLVNRCDYVRVSGRFVRRDAHDDWFREEGVWAQPNFTGYGFNSTSRAKKLGNIAKLFTKDGHGCVGPQEVDLFLYHQNSDEPFARVKKVHRVGESPEAGGPTRFWAELKNEFYSDISILAQANDEGSCCSTEFMVEEVRFADYLVNLVNESDKVDKVYCGEGILAFRLQGYGEMGLLFYDPAEKKCFGSHLSLEIGRNVCGDAAYTASIDAVLSKAEQAGLDVSAAQITLIGINGSHMMLTPLEYPKEPLALDAFKSNVLKNLEKSGFKTVNDEHGNSQRCFLDLSDGQIVYAENHFLDKK